MGSIGTGQVGPASTFPSIGPALHKDSWRGDGSSGARASATIGSFGQIKSQRLKNEAGEQMTMQNVGFAMVFQFNNQSVDLAPSQGTQWHAPDMPHQWESKSGVVGKFVWSVN